MRHEEDEAPLQLAHEEWHDEHVPCPLTTSTKLPVVGQLARQVPDERKGLPPVAEHERQLLVAGPLHVVHEPSHGSQTDDALAYLPTGVHEARHEPGSLKNGWVVPHPVHSPEPGPWHVAQLESHATHVSATDDEPPEHA